MESTARIVYRDDGSWQIVGHSIGDIMDSVRFTSEQVGRIRFYNSAYKEITISNHVYFHSPSNVVSIKHRSRNAGIFRSSIAEDWDPVDYIFDFDSNCLVFGDQLRISSPKDKWVTNFEYRFNDPPEYRRMLEEEMQQKWHRQSMVNTFMEQGGNEW